MPDYLMGYLDDEMGADDELGYGDELGRRPRGRGPNALLARRAAAARALARRAVPSYPGVPPNGARRLPLGFPNAVFTNTSGLILTVSTQPQIPIVGQRLVTAVTRVGAGATGAVTIADIKVGQRSQLASVNPIPVEAFAANAFGVQLDLDPAQPGITVSITYQIAAAPGAAESVTISAALINPSIG